MNLNKEFLSEVIKYLISRGVTLTDVLDTFNEHFNTSDNAIKYEQEKHVKEILQQKLNGKKIADILIERNISVDTFTRRYIYQNMPLEKACSNLVPLTEQINKQQKLQDDILYIKPVELAKNLNIPITSLSEYIESGDLPPTNNGKWLRKDIESNSFYQRHLNK